MGQATVRLNKTFAIVTEESAQHGDFADQGFEFENREFTLRELAEELQEYCVLSQSHGIDERTWAISESEQDFQTGDYTTYSLHLGNEPTEREKRIWVAALNFVFGD